VLLKPDGKQFAITLDQFKGEDLAAIEALMKNGVSNWNNSGPAPVQVVADVTIRADGTYESLSIKGFHIDNG